MSSLGNCCAAMELACRRLASKQRSDFGIEQLMNFRTGKLSSVVCVRFPKAKKGDTDYDGPRRDTRSIVCNYCPFCAARLTEDDRAEGGDR